MLKIVKRKGSPHWQIHGTYKGVRVRESTGTDDEDAARRIKLERERQILYGVTGETGKGPGKTFADAIEAYLDKGGEDRYIGKINEIMGKTPLEDVTQGLIDQKAGEAYGEYKKGEKGTARKHRISTIKRQFYDPVAAVMHTAADLKWVPYMRIKRPKVSLPPPEWAEPEWFSKLWKVCGKDMKALTMFLCLTGCRIQECLDLSWDDVDLKRQAGFIRKTKTDAYRTVHLPPPLARALKGIRKRGKEKVFHMWGDQDSVHRALQKACKAAKIKYMSSHKIGSHTYATWLRRYAGMDSRGLMDTGRWASKEMADRYTHTDVSAESKKADILGKLFE